MAVSNLKSLIGKLNETCRSALESAAGLCLSQTHYEVEIEHFLIKLLEMSDTDLLKILKHFEINDAHLVADLTRAIEKFKTGNARTPALSPTIPQMIREAWMYASVEYQTPKIRSGQVVLALLDSEQFNRMLLASSDTLKKISVETLKESLMDLTAGSIEDMGAAEAGEVLMRGEVDFGTLTLSIHFSKDAPLTISSTVSPSGQPPGAKTYSSSGSTRSSGGERISAEVRLRRLRLLLRRGRHSWRRPQ